VEEIRRDPSAALARVPRKLAALWAPDFFLARQLLRDGYGPTPPSLAALWVGLTWAWAAVALLAGPAALAALARQRFRSLALLWVGAYLAVHAVFFGASRMHFPLVPLLALAVAGFLWDPTRPPRPGRGLRRGGVWAALAGFAWFLGSAAVAGLYVSPGPRHLGMARVLGSARHLPVPAARRAAWMLAEVEASNGHAERADAILAEPRFAGDPWSLYLRGIIQRDPELAQRWFDRALEIDPDLFAAWAASGWLHLKLGDFAAAAAALERAASLRPWDTDIRADLAMVRDLDRESRRSRMAPR
jgi:tetratricopeptide (TPR) repeat protein